MRKARSFRRPFMRTAAEMSHVLRLSLFLAGGCDEGRLFALRPFWKRGLAFGISLFQELDHFIRQVDPGLKEFPKIDDTLGTEQADHF